MFLQSKRGISTDQMAKGKKVTKTFIIEFILKFTTFATAGVQVISIIYHRKLSIIIQNDFVRYAGIIISSLGVLVFITAMVIMRDSWRAGIYDNQDTKLINRGIYKYSRNPAFVGFDLFYFGIALIFSNVLNIIFACSSIIMLHLQILEEEKFLPSVFGEAYLDYMEKTSRYFGAKKIK